VTRRIIGPLIPDIAEDLRIGLDSIGSTISLATFSFLLLSLVTGNLLEIIGAKNVFYIGLGSSIAGCIMMYLSHSFGLFISGYLIVVTGSGILYVANHSIIASIYKDNKTSSLMILNMGNVAGLIISPLIASMLLFIDIDWRIFYLASLIFLIALIIVLFKIRIPEISRIEGNLRSLFTANRKIMSNAAFILCCIMIFFYIAIFNTFFMWFTSYFQNIGVKTQISSLFLALYSTAILIGMMLRNRLMRYFQEKKILLSSFIISFFLLLGVLLIKDLVFKNIMIFLYGIAIAGNFPIIFSIGSNLFPKYQSSASGLMIAFSNLGIIVFQYLSGYLSEYYSKNSVLYINLFNILVMIVLTLILFYDRRFRQRDIIYGPDIRIS
jgi:fucose permease